MKEQTKDTLKNEIKIFLLETLNITDIKLEDISDSEPLFSGTNAIGLDSIDAVEITMALQRKYGVHFDDQNLPRFILTSIDTIAEFVNKELNK